MVSERVFAVDLRDGSPRMGQPPSLRWGRVGSVVLRGWVFHAGGYLGSKNPRQREREKTEARLSRSHEGRRERASLPGLFGFCLAESFEPFVWFSAEKCWNGWKLPLETWYLQQIDALMSPRAPFAHGNVEYSKLNPMTTQMSYSPQRSAEWTFSHFESLFYLIQRSWTVKIIWPLSPGTQHGLSFFNFWTKKSLCVCVCVCVQIELCWVGSEEKFFTAWALEYNSRWSGNYQHDCSATACSFRVFRGWENRMLISSCCNSLSWNG